MKILPTFFEQYALKERIFVSKHQALICCCPMVLLETLKSFFMLLDSGFQLLDVFCSPFPESCLSLAIALLTFFRCRVNLRWH